MKGIIEGKTRSRLSFSRRRSEGGGSCIERDEAFSLGRLFLLIHRLPRQVAVIYSKGLVVEDRVVADID